MNNGYVKLYRNILNNNAIKKSNDHLAVYIYLLCHASYDDKPVIIKNRPDLILAGQLITGRKKLSKELNMSESKIYRILNCLECEHLIEQLKDSKYTRITVLDLVKNKFYEPQLEHNNKNNKNIYN